MAEYIEREAVMEALMDEQYGYLCEEAIQAIPNADVAPVRRGEWRLCKSWNPDYEGFECSECGARFQGIHRDNYCGNCGAKMEEDNG